jgi:CTP synthase
MQTMCIEFSRNVLGWEDANSTEFDSRTAHPVIDIMNDQKTLTDKGGTMRLGHYPCVVKPGTHAAAAYNLPQVDERHRHRFELNNAFRDEMEKAGMVFSGISPDGRLVEIAELKDHPFMLGTQFHPEFQSRPDNPQPLFVAFLRAVIDHQARHIDSGNESKPFPAPTRMSIEEHDRG